MLKYQKTIVDSQIGSKMPSYFSWRHCTPENNQKLRERVEACKADRIFQLGLLQDSCKIPNLSKWLHKAPLYSQLRYHQYAALAFHGITNGWIGRDEEAYYDEFSSFLGINTSELSRATLERHYEVHRLSFLAKGFVLRGSLTLTRSSKTVAIHVKEFHCIQPIVAKEIGRGEIDLPFPRSGHLFSRGGNEYLMISRKDRYPNEIQTSYLQDHGDMNQFEGSFSDWHGRDIYYGYMIASATEKPLDEKDAKAMRPHEIDPAILKKLKENRKSNLLRLRSPENVLNGKKGRLKKEGRLTK